MNSSLRKSSTAAKSAKRWTLDNQMSKAISSATQKLDNQKSNRVKSRKRVDCKVFRSLCLRESLEKVKTTKAWAPRVLWELGWEISTKIRATSVRSAKSSYKESSKSLKRTRSLVFLFHNWTTRSGRNISATLYANSKRVQTQRMITTATSASHIDLLVIILRVVLIFSLQCEEIVRLLNSNIETRKTNSIRLWLVKARIKLEEYLWGDAKGKRSLCSTLKRSQYYRDSELH